MVGLSCVIRGDGEKDIKDSTPAGCCRNGHAPLMTPHNTHHGRQTQPPAGAFGGKKGIKNFTKQLRRNTRPIVFYLQLHKLPLSHLCLPYPLVRNGRLLGQGNFLGSENNFTRPGAYRFGRIQQ